MESKKTALGSLCEVVDNLMPYLYSRWQDEKGHEDFKDYENLMRLAVEKVEGATFVQGYNYPFFGFIFKIAETDLTYSVEEKGDNLYRNIKPTVKQAVVFTVKPNKKPAKSAKKQKPKLKM